MASSQKQFTTDLKDIEESQDKEAPVDVINIMLEYGDLNKTGGHGATPLVTTLFSSIKSQKLTHLKHLLTAIVSGNLDETKAILEKDPFLLIEKLEEKDFIIAPSGQRSNNGTAYRTALAVEDTQMAVMIKSKLIEVAGEQVANAQYHEQFPERWEEVDKARWMPIFIQLNTLTNLIINAKPGDITSSGHPTYKVRVREGSAVAIALTRFRSELDGLLHEITTSGRHFNPNLLLNAFKIYDNRFEDFGDNWRDPRAILFWQRVIGTIQRGLPVNYVQAFCNSLHVTHKKLRDNHPQGRSLKIELLNAERGAQISSDYYPFSLFHLGFDHAIYSASEPARLFAMAARGNGCGQGLQSLCQSKTACMQTLLTPHQFQTPKGLFSHCVIL